MPILRGKPLVMTVPAPPLRQNGITLVEFVQHTRSDPIIDEVVRIMPNHGGALHPCGAAPALEPKYLFIECEGESSGPWLELFGDESLQEGGEGSLITDALVACSLVYKGDDPNASETTYEDFTPFGNMQLLWLQVSG